MDKTKLDILNSCLNKLPNLSTNSSNELKLLFTNYISTGKLDKDFFTEPEKAHFSKNYMRKMRLFLQNSMQRSIATNSVMYSPEVVEMLHFVFWCAEIELTDTASAYIIMEDVYDCLCLKEIV